MVRARSRREDPAALEALTEPDETPGRQPSRAGRAFATLVIALTALLLVAAAGMAAAAVVENRPTTWRSTALVRLVPASVPQAGMLQLAGMHYASVYSNHEFTANAAARAGLPTSAVRGDVRVSQRAAGDLLLEVHAADPRQAAALASAAADNLVLAVDADLRATIPDPHARLGVTVLLPFSEPVKTQPLIQDVILGASLSAGLVLLIATSIAVGTLNRRAGRRSR